MIGLTVTELVTEVKFEVDKLDTGAVPEIAIESIGVALNKAQEKYIKQRYRPVRELLSRNIGFEEIQKRIDDLSVLVKTEELSTTLVTSLTDVSEVDLDLLVDSDGNPNYMFFLRGRVKVDGSYRPTRLRRHDQLDIVDIDPFNKTNARKPVIYFEEGNIRVKVPTGTTVDKIAVTFLRAPSKIVVEGTTTQTIELRGHTHREIVQVAANDLLEQIESRRVQTHGIKTLNVE